MERTNGKLLAIVGFSLVLVAVFSYLRSTRIISPLASKSGIILIFPP